MQKEYVKFMRKDNKKNIKMYVKNVCTNQKCTIKVYTSKNGIPTKYLRIKCTQKICQQINCEQNI